MPNLKKAQSIDDLRDMARKRLPRAVFDFFDGGAEEEATLTDNRRAFQRLRLIPHMLNDVSKIETATDILGAQSNLPIVIAPTGAPGFGWPRAEVPLAKAAARMGIPFILSTSATASIERIARETSGRFWFQTYIFRRREVTAGLIRRALDANCEALMVTLDMPAGGKRERDMRNDFGLPFRYTARNCLDFASRPAWVLSMLRSGLPKLENLIGFMPDAATTAAAASSVGKSYDPSFIWDDLKAIRDAWPRKFLVKGILHPADAEKAAAIGCDAISVSNHGGRQLDGAIAAIDALPAIVAAVGKKTSVMVDGGVRRGVDIVKALALGASAVLVGRATLYGVSVGGEDGAMKALEILRDEMIRAMQLCGTRTLRDIRRDLIAP